ncbi:ParA family protein [Kitasatospora cineracea]|uniref:Chromosome partitioning protein n=1 Tax=Kitasatospora cineracea TaxID=88074 RepID=A0A3N4R9E0_9ACTN|nr:AAA family ATPase [Kitasatospora cineracea]RPE27221.1 chromosome partitioning protein [Kitasatospora cineracea]RPE27352.1 chromosome partitioning protein [Kitasatospora cineracea]
MPPSLPETRIIAFTNQAGGAGKSTATVTIGAWLAEFGLKVLVVDLDAQSDSAQALGYDEPEQMDGQPTLYNLLIGTPGVGIRDTIVPALAGALGAEGTKPIEGLDILLPSAELESAEQLLTGQLARELWLTKTLAPVADDYDVILLDCPGNLGLVVVNALVAAKEVVACVKPTWKELRALTRIEQTIERISQSFGPNGAAPELVGILIADVPTTRSAGAVYDDSVKQARDAYGDLVLPTIRRSTRVPDSYAAQKPLPVFDRVAEVTDDFNAVVKALGFARLKK